MISEGTFLPERRRSLADKFAHAVERVFVLGDTPEEGAVRHALNAIMTRPIAKGELVRSALTVVRHLLPKSLKVKFYSRVFDKFPLELPRKNGYRGLEKLGSGGVNTVYLLNRGNGPSFAVGTNRVGFSDQESAQKYAQYQQADFDHINEMYNSIPGLVPLERQIIYTDQNDKPNVMFIREFVPGPLRDIFKIPIQQLSRIVQANPDFAGQLRQFLEISDKNREFVLGQQLDLLGDDNLSVVGGPGQEKLVLLDPHTRYSGKTPAKEEEIGGRLLYLQTAVRQSDIIMSEV